jgi:hypothetical protein
MFGVIAIDADAAPLAEGAIAGEAGGPELAIDAFHDATER